VEHLLTLNADLASGRILRRALVQLCGEQQLAGEAVGDFALAVSEAFSNAVRHGVHEMPASVTAHIVITDQFGSVMLEYPGEPFALHPPKLPEADSTGGRGRYLISVLVDHVDYTFKEGITYAELRKCWPADPSRYGSTGPEG
jgi:anti-sigma regulatory factor (Ser/Thr protein kinase)